MTGSVICSIALVLVVLQHAFNLSGKPSELRTVVGRAARATMCVQQFKLWGVPPTQSASFDYPATLKNGESIDLFFLNEEPPQRVYDRFSSHHWRRVHSELLEGRQPTDQVHEKLRARFLDWLVRRYNLAQSGQAQVQSAQIILYEKPILPDVGFGPVEESVLCDYQDRP